MRDLAKPASGLFLARGVVEQRLEPVAIQNADVFLLYADKAFVVEL